MKVTKTYFLFLFLLFACSEDNSINSFYNSKYYQQDLTNGSNQKHIPKLNPIDTGSIWEKPSYTYRNMVEFKLGGFIINLIDEKKNISSITLSYNNKIKFLKNNQIYNFFREYYSTEDRGGWRVTYEIITSISFIFTPDYLINFTFIEDYFYAVHSWADSFDEEKKDTELTFAHLPYHFHNDTIFVSIEASELANQIAGIYYKQEEYGENNLKYYSKTKTFDSIASTDSAYIDIKIY